MFASLGRPLLEVLRPRQREGRQMTDQDEIAACYPPTATYGWVRARSPGLGQPKYPSLDPQPYEDWTESMFGSEQKEVPGSRSYLRKALTIPPKALLGTLRGLHHRANPQSKSQGFRDKDDQVQKHQRSDVTVCVTRRRRPSSRDGSPPPPPSCLRDVRSIEVLVASHNRHSVERTIQKMTEMGVAQETGPTTR